MKRILVMLFAVGFALNANAQGDCMNPDVNCDGYVNVSDLLGLLGYFGAEDVDGDGIWDSQDDCVDDGCGVCDGPGPQVLVIDTITITIDSIFVEAINEWYVFQVPDTTFTFVCSNPGCTDPAAGNYNPDATEDDGSCIGSLNPCADGSTAITFDGYTYDLIGIGDQCWFAENLRAEHYANGDSISANLSDWDWVNASGGAVGVFGEGSGCLGNSPDGDVCDPTWSLNEYGRLYNWYAVDDARGLCPYGWHVPTDEEWMALEMELGMSESEAYSTDWRGTGQGALMKTTFGWFGGGLSNGTNSTGFAGLPGGYRESYGAYLNAGSNSNWWTSSLNGGASWGRVLSFSSDDVYRQQFGLDRGFSVRCLQDCTGPGCVNPGCTDPTAENYNPYATVDDGSCVSSYPCANASSVAYYGYTYDLVEIGDQCWFAENLRTEHYANGDPIPANLSDNEWISTSGGASAVYGEHEGCDNSFSPEGNACDPVWSLNEFGRLYNWYAVDDERGLCPTGWHVPTDGEWMTLEMELGMTEAQANDIGPRGTDQGMQMKTSYGWFSGGNGANSSGFSGLPGGYRDIDGSFWYSGAIGDWWSSSSSGNNAWDRILNSWDEGVSRNNYSPGFGVSVRCVKDD